MQWLCFWSINHDDARLAILTPEDRATIGKSCLEPLALVLCENVETSTKPACGPSGRSLAGSSWIRNASPTRRRAWTQKKRSQKKSVPWIVCTAHCHLEPAHHVDSEGRRLLGAFLCFKTSIHGARAPYALQDLSRTMKPHTSFRESHSTQK